LVILAGSAFDYLFQSKKEVLDGFPTRAKPTTTDFRARVLLKMKWEVGERRLRDVIDLGEAGLIK
jgi:hypothetical protein